MEIDKANFITSNSERIDTYYEIKNKKDDIIGKGNFGLVMKGISKQSKAKRAVKVIKKAKLPDPDKFKTELIIMRTLDHPNIIRLMEVFEDKKYIYFVMELCTGGELFESVTEEGSYSEEKARSAFMQLMKAINYLHSRGICHRDIKPENFLYANKKNDTLKLIDFGVSKIFCTDSKSLINMRTKAGSLFYISPEVLKGSYNELYDIWSAGVILYILLSGYPPFFDNSDNVVMDKIKTGEYSMEGEEWDVISDDAKDLISRMITFQGDRISASEVLKHPWLCNTNLSANIKINAKGIKNFYQAEKFKRIALTALAFHSDAEVDELGRVFNALDRDGDGHLSYDELLEGLSGMLGDESKEILSLYKENMTPGSRINYQEFIASTINLQSTFDSEVTLKKAFKTFDKNGDGKITADELREILGNNKHFKDKGMEFWNEMINEVDTNGDGEIDYEEFCALMTGKQLL